MSKEAAVMLVLVSMVVFTHVSHVDNRIVFTHVIRRTGWGNLFQRCSARINIVWAEHLLLFTTTRYEDCDYPESIRGVLASV